MPAPTPTVVKLQAQVSAALVRAGFFGERGVLVVGVSGGPDSSALLYCLHRLQESHGLRLHVAHLNHDFRGDEADADARFVSDLAQELGLPASVEKREVTDYQREHRISSFEHAARELRYGFLAEVAAQAGAAAVVVGHTADDLAETALLHLLRGSGLHGLRGMSERSPWPWPGDAPGLWLFRPLLAATRQDTEACCRELGRTFREDTGNSLPRFTRNRVRHHLLPLLAAGYNPRVREAVVRLARAAALEVDYLESEVDRVWPQVAEGEAGSLAFSGVRFQAVALTALHPLLQRLVLRRGYSVVTGAAHRLEENHLQAMYDLAQAGVAGRSVALPGGLWLHSTHDQLLLTPDAGPPCPFPELDGPYALELPTAMNQVTELTLGGWRVAAQLAPRPEVLDAGDGFTAWLAPGALTGRVQVRARQAGDRFWPLGMTQEKKLQDFFTDLKVPRTWRDRVPLLESAEGIAWVVGYRVAEWARVEDSPVEGAPVLRVGFEQVHGLEKISLRNTWSHLPELTDQDFDEAKSISEPTIED
ncbi:MAG: tRNA lysidine(34) synthetase TilS [Dehalococcoidia bacterium]|nr:tRNA lysidine(34) synthetase TilS [Dehalococcoidia bacterium]MSQ16174.1 tRNA lysidine(34) synthetase TilS [Dehalococcoidia bacterium]